MEDVFGKGTIEGTRPLLPPGNCWICDNSPQQEEMKVIDTRRNTQAGGALSHLSNRKYICEPCAIQMGEAVGLVKRVDYDALEVDLRKAEAAELRLVQELAEARASQTRVVSSDDIVRLIDEKFKERDEKAAQSPTISTKISGTITPEAAEKMLSATELPAGRARKK